MDADILLSLVRGHELIPAQAVEAAARQLAACYGIADFDSETVDDRNYWLDLVRSLANATRPKPSGN